MTNSSPFITHLLSLPPGFAADLNRTKPRGHNVRHKILLLEGSQGGERQARETIIKLYGLHGLHTPGVPLMQTLGLATQQGLNEATVDHFIFAHRTELSRLLTSVITRLAQLKLGFDYELLYRDLRYHRHETSVRWQDQYQRARLAPLTPKE